ncbi:MAG: glycosyltransferase, exosortase A system-associated [Polyangiaceae bacterium]|jgi:PEP-CTERM/exosortase A-associated glycosyltransferase|nr:glycosyltransferase, exosortase A system-associated [Polyangiaceae bacterium]
MTLRILHVLDHSVPLHSGYTFRTLAILKEQRKLGWETLQLTSSKHRGATADEEDVEGFHFYRTRASTAGLRAPPLVSQFAVIRDTERRLSQVIGATRPDIVHAHSPSLNGIAALRAVRRTRIPVVYEVRAFWEDAAVDHGTTREGSLRYRLSRTLETWALRRADAVTTICEGLRDDIVGRGLQPDRVTVIPNAVSTEEFPLIDAPDPELQARLGLADAFTLGFLGSFYGYEGLDTLLDALPQILRFEPKARVMLVGGGFEEGRLKAQAKRLGLSDRVVFTGRVPHAEIARYYGLVDLLVYPRKSMRLTETVTPLKPLEAMAQGRLLIASDVGGHRELIEDGATGFLFEPGRPAELAAAVARVLRHRDRWDSIRANGRRHVETKRTWRVSVGRYHLVYQSALRVAAGR